MVFYSGKKVWITGASSGLGSELAGLLLQYGAKVVLTARNKTALDDIAGRVADQQVCVLPGDMENLDSLQTLAESAWNAFDGLDMVIWNAGVSHRSFFTDTSAEVGRKVLTVNLYSQIELTRYLLPEMLQRGKGHIVSVTSMAGRIASPMRSYYAAAKHGLHGFFHTIRVEASGSGVMVSLVVPGFLRTDISRHALAGNGTAWDKNDRNQLLGTESKRAAQLVLKKLTGRGRDIYVGYPFRASTALFLGTRFPCLFEKILRKTDYT